MTDVRLNTEMEGRCMKCKLPRPFTATEINIMKNGGSMAKGKCPICDTTICRMLSKLTTSDTSSLGDLLPKTGKKRPSEKAMEAVEEEETF